MSSSNCIKYKCLYSSDTYNSVYTMSSNTLETTQDDDTIDLQTLPYVGPGTAETLRENGYNTYEDIAVTTPLQLFKDAGVGLSDTSGIINTSINRLRLSCPECGSPDNSDDAPIRPIWSGYPDTIEEDEKEEAMVYCDQCLWAGTIYELLD